MPPSTCSCCTAQPTGTSTRSGPVSLQSQSLPVPPFITITLLPLGVRAGSSASKGTPKTWWMPKCAGLRTSFAWRWS
jgi:hypothetical protein